MPSKTGNKEAFETTTPKYWVKTLITYLLLALVLLISGWDTAWCQGWIYSALLVIAGLGPRFWAEKRHPGLMAERAKLGKDQNVKSWDKVLSLLMVVSLTFPLFIVTGLDHHFGWSPAFPAWLNILGFFFIVSGYAFASWALIENRFFSSMVRIQKDRGHVVCDSGPYRIVRHPGYAGHVLSLPGIVLALGSVWSIIPAFAALIIAVIRTTLEDKTLQAELQGYQDYASRVRYRLIPGVF